MAVIGAGIMGKNHARVFSELPNVVLTAICDTDLKNGEALANKYGCKFYSDYNELLLNENITAVSIAVPTYLHHKVSMDILNKGIHVLLEKPIATTSDEAVKIIKKAREKGVVLMVGHIERFNPIVRKLAEIVASGKFGKVISINVRRLGGLPPQTKNANVILDLAIHDIDIANYLLGELPVDIYANKSKAVLKDQEDNAFILLKYPTSSAYIEVNWLTPAKIRVLDITGTKAFARLDYIDQKMTLYENGHFANGLYKDFEEFRAKFYSPKITNIELVKEEPLKCEIKEFVSAVLEKREPSFKPEDALRALEVALRI